MATTKDYRDYALEQLSSIEDITCKPMMGEFLLYYKGVLFGGLYDNRFLVKKTRSLSSLDLCTAIPYEGAKPMFLISNIYVIVCIYTPKIISVKICKV